MFLAPLNISRKEFNPSGKIQEIKKEEGSSFPSTKTKKIRMKSIPI